MIAIAMAGIGGYWLIDTIKKYRIYKQKYRPYFPDSYVHYYAVNKNWNLNDKAREPRVEASTTWEEWTNDES